MFTEKAYRAKANQSWAYDATTLTYTHCMLCAHKNQQWVGMDSYANLHVKHFDTEMHAWQIWKQACMHARRQAEESETIYYWHFHQCISYIHDGRGVSSMYYVPLHSAQCIHFYYQQCHAIHNMQFSVDIALSHSWTVQSHGLSTTRGAGDGWMQPIQLATKKA